MGASPLIAAGAGIFGLPIIAAMVFFGSGAGDPPPDAAMVCSASLTPGAGDATATSASISLTAAQTDQAATIVAATKALGMDQHAAAIAIMVARQESTLANLANPTVPASLAYPHEGLGSNADSLGVFQQRPSMGWGTVAQLMDPGYAAAKFLSTLAAVSGWESMPAWQAGQKVQVSADGTLYEQWQSLGEAVAAALFDGTSGALTCTDLGLSGPLPAPNTAAAAAAIAYATAQLGKPYVYGGTGPDVFDCSGLVLTAFAAAGITLPRTAEYQIDAGYPVPQKQLQPGDLVFFNLGEQIAGRPGHVGIYLGNGLMIDAPHTGAVVRIEAVEEFGSYVGARRIVATPPST